MRIEYKHFCTIPGKEIFQDILKLHKVIFGKEDDFTEKLRNKSNLLFNVALEGEKVTGYKIGYKLDNEKYYSWLGGVSPEYRGLGIGSTLMKNQHLLLKEKGYKVVQTKTLNKWRNMLILNIKCGFDIAGTYTDDNGVLKIVLEKNLSEG